MVRKGALLAGMGVVIEVLAARAAAPVIGLLLYGVSPHGVIVFGSIPVALVVVPLAARCIPARCAAKADPIKALRLD
jgi:hypothetical protein